MTKIISGGQTGADRAALQWARAHGHPTGGWMPEGFRAEDGKHPEMAILYGMKQTMDWRYGPRTRLNVQEADKTLIFGNHNSPGCRLTIKFCEKFQKPYAVVKFPGRFPIIAFIREFVYGVNVLNIAGNREQKNPGIGEFVKKTLTAVFGEFIP